MKGVTIMTNTEWHTGQVDVGKEHIELLWSKDKRLICRLQPEGNNSFIVQFENDIDEQRIKAAEKELDFYLIELNERNPWTYAKYYCASTCNWYLEVRWS
jgi:hypothetical protein